MCLYVLSGGEAAAAQERAVDGLITSVHTSKQREDPRRTASPRPLKKGGVKLSRLLVLDDLGLVGLVHVGAEREAHLVLERRLVALLRPGMRGSDRREEEREEREEGREVGGV